MYICLHLDVLYFLCRLISDLVVVIVSATCGGIAFACAGQPVSVLVHLLPLIEYVTNFTYHGTNVCLAKSISVTNMLSPNIILSWTMINLYFAETNLNESRDQWCTKRAKILIFFFF